MSTHEGPKVALTHDLGWLPVDPGNEEERVRNWISHMFQEGWSAEERDEIETAAVEVFLDAISRGFKDIVYWHTTGEGRDENNDWMWDVIDAVTVGMGIYVSVNGNGSDDDPYQANLQCVHLVDGYSDRPRPYRGLKEAILLANVPSEYIADVLAELVQQEGPE